MTNSEIGRLLEETEYEGYEEAAVMRYLHDFVHMVHKPTVPGEEQVGHLERWRLNSVVLSVIYVI